MVHFRAIYETVFLISWILNKNDDKMYKMGTTGEP